MAHHGPHFGGTVPVKSSRTCIVYDGETGRVHHIHEVVTLEGGREPGEAQIEADAMEIVNRKGKNVAKLRTLHLPTEKVPEGGLLTVDLKTKTLQSRALAR